MSCILESNFWALSISAANHQWFKDPISCLSLMKSPWMSIGIVPISVIISHVGNWRVIARDGSLPKWTACQPIPAAGKCGAETLISTTMVLQRDNRYAAHGSSQNPSVSWDDLIIFTKLPPRPSILYPCTKTKLPIDGRSATSSKFKDPKIKTIKYRNIGIAD